MPWLTIFALGYGVNFIWEVLHARLYTHFAGGPITRSVLLYATFVDAAVVVMAISLAKLTRPPARPWLVAGVGLLAALAIEWRALRANRWTYQFSMPVLPVINTGLSPTVQLALTSWLVYAILCQPTSRGQLSGGRKAGCTLLFFCWAGAARARGVTELPPQSPRCGTESRRGW